MYKVLKGIGKIKREDNKLTLVKFKFSMEGNSELKQEEISSLSETAKYFFHFTKRFGQNEKQRMAVGVWIRKDPL